METFEFVVTSIARAVYLKLDTTLMTLLREETV